MSALALGYLYYGETSDKPLRIIGLDDFEVFYDAQWSDKSWTFSGNFKRRGYFYRTSAKTFKKHFNKIGETPLTSEELSVFRPDLPMRISRTKDLNWNDLYAGDKEAEYVCENMNKNFRNQTINTNSIVLLPYGKKGGLKRGVPILAENSSYFTVTELILKAKEIQEAENDEKSNGIGIYRLGFEKGIPSYRIGEYTDEYISILGID